MPLVMGSVVLVDSGFGATGESGGGRKLGFNFLAGGEGGGEGEEPREMGGRRRFWLGRVIFVVMAMSG